MIHTSRRGLRSVKLREQLLPCIRPFRSVFRTRYRFWVKVCHTNIRPRALYIGHTQDNSLYRIHPLHTFLFLDWSFLNCQDISKRTPDEEEMGRDVVFLCGLVTLAG